MPFELYVRGTHYKNVFLELTKINELLNTEDSSINLLSTYTKTEDDALSKAKDNMEFLYKRFMYIDKRMFS